MKPETRKAIDYGADRGLGFHVFCNVTNYLGGQAVEVHEYQGSYQSLGVAQAIAEQKDGVVYNSEYTRV